MLITDGSLLSDMGNMRVLHPLKTRKPGLRELFQKLLQTYLSDYLEGGHYAKRRFA